MTSSMRMALKTGERVYINGAVIEVDRKVSLFLLNNATFLLGSHVLQAEDANTPLRQIYFVVQTLLMDPSGEGDAKRLFGDLLANARSTFSQTQILNGLDEVAGMVELGQPYAALKKLRKLYPLETAAFGRPPENARNDKGQSDNGRINSQFDTTRTEPRPARSCNGGG